MNILIIHRRYPGHFGDLADSLAAHSNHKVAFASQYLVKEVPSNIERVAFSPQEAGSLPDTPPGINELRAFAANGQAVFTLCKQLKQRGWIPDVVVAHNGWGVMLYVRSVFPKTRLIGHFEWYYNNHDSDVDFLAPALATPEKAQKLQLRNMTILAGINDCDIAVTPTKFQASQFPALVRQKLTVLHEGIDTRAFTPPDIRPRRIGTLDLSSASHILTYATRGLEAYRGFPQFMRALSALQKKHSQLHTVVAGEDAVFYGPRPSSGNSWKTEMLAALPDLDASRVHFVGTLPFEQYRQLLHASDCHVYYTVPFVLSWSLLEAMAAGCAVVASRTAPVEEVITHQQTGWLTPFFDSKALSAQISAVLAMPPARKAAITEAARAHIAQRYEKAECLRRWLKLVEKT